MLSILSDSCADLNAELIQKFEIHTVPLHVTLGEKSFFDGVDITPGELFAYVRQTGLLPKTSAVSTEEMKHFFSGFEDIIFIGIGSKLSATFQSALLAKEQMPEKNIQVIDSQNLSSGIGLLVLRAAELKLQGLPADEITSQINSLVPKVKTSFVIDTLEYLYKGGRCSALANFFGSMLHIRPVIEVKNGALVVKDKIGGSRKKALDSLLLDFKKNLNKIDLHRVFVTHSGCDSDAAYIKKELLSIAPIENLEVTIAGATVSSHCGPNTIGILYFEK